MRDEEDLDCNIVCPSFPSSPTLNNDDKGYYKLNQLKELYKKHEQPVIVLLGWAGCQDKYLAKYSAIYEEKCCITLRYTAPVKCLFWQRDKLPNIGKRLIKVIKNKNLDQHPIFFHVFSNGGAFLYQHVSLAMQKDYTPLKVKGVIFDSAPGERRLTALFKAISAIIGGHPLMNIPMSLLITIFLSILWLLEVIAHALGREYPVQTNPFALVEESYSWPQLFLYSNADTLIPASDVEKFASRRAERGVWVQLVLFTNSPHVKHYATYRDVYANTVFDFIIDCFSNTENEKTKQTAVPRLSTRVVLPHEATSKPN
ncbi:Transmembrane protein 53 [Anthophora plagiata]